MPGISRFLDNVNAFGGTSHHCSAPDVGAALPQHCSKQDAAASALSFLQRTKKIDAIVDVALQSRFTWRQSRSLRNAGSFLKLPIAGQEGSVEQTEGNGSLATHQANLLRPKVDECGCLRGDADGKGSRLRHGWNPKTFKCEKGLHTSAFDKQVCRRTTVGPRKLRALEVEIENGDQYITIPDDAGKELIGQNLLIVVATNDLPPHPDGSSPPVFDFGTD